MPAIVIWYGRILVQHALLLYIARLCLLATSSLTKVKMFAELEQPARWLKMRLRQPLVVSYFCARDRSPSILSLHVTSSAYASKGSWPLIGTLNYSVSFLFLQHTICSYLSYTVKTYVKYVFWKYKTMHYIKICVKKLYQNPPEHHNKSTLEESNTRSAPML
jgi:hypothetical protein